MEKWLIKAFNDRDQRSSAWLFLFAIACMIALFGALNSASIITAVMVVALGVAATGYIYEKSFYRRLVKSVRQGKSAPQVFTGGNGDATRNYVSSMFSTPRTMFDKDGKPARFSYEPSALDLVWLTSINEALPLKQALCGRDQFPVAISHPEKEVVTPLPQPESHSKITYKIDQKVYFDHRQVHVHAAAETTNRPSRKAAGASKSEAIKEITPHWLYPLGNIFFENRSASFEEHLPKSLKWMWLVVHQAYPVVQRHEGWNDTHLLNETLEHIAVLRSDPNSGKKLPELPDPATIKKMFNRGRSDPSYGWVREYFTDARHLHKYQDPDQDRLDLSSPD